jgi:hypothetical protein
MNFPNWNGSSDRWSFFRRNSCLASPAVRPPPARKEFSPRHRLAGAWILSKPSLPASPRAETGSGTSATRGGTGRSSLRPPFAGHRAPSPVVSAQESRSFARSARCRPFCTDVRKCQSKHKVDRWNPQPASRRHLISRFSGGPSSILRPRCIAAG